jgi:hypothetical protein
VQQILRLKRSNGYPQEVLEAAVFCDEAQRRSLCLKLMAAGQEIELRVAVPADRGTDWDWAERLLSPEYAALRHDLEELARSIS